MNKTFTNSILALVTVAISLFYPTWCLDSCQGEDCQRPVNTFDIPLTDKVNAPLKAELDISALNSQLRRLIKREVTLTLAKATKDFIDSSVRNRLKELGLGQNNASDTITDTRPQESNNDTMRLLKEMRLPAYNLQTVAFTACSFDNRQVTRGTVIKFDDVKTSYGVEMSKFVTSGEFACQVPALYQIIATVKSHTDRASFNINKNRQVVMSGFVAEHNVRDKSTNYDHTGIAVVVVLLDKGDTVTVTAEKDMYLHSETCLTVVKI